MVLNFQQNVPFCMSLSMLLKFLKSSCFFVEIPQVPMFFKEDASEGGNTGGTRVRIVATTLNTLFDYI